MLSDRVRLDVGRIDLFDILGLFLLGSAAMGLGLWVGDLGALAGVLGGVCFPDGPYMAVLPVAE